MAVRPFEQRPAGAFLCQKLRGPHPTIQKVGATITKNQALHHAVDRVGAFQALLARPAPRGAVSIKDAIQGFREFAVHHEAIPDGGLKTHRGKRTSLTFGRSEEHTSELQSLIRSPSAEFCRK